MSLSLSRTLEFLRAGLLRDGQKIADAVAEFGRENYIEAKPDVEALLDHPDPLVRYAAIGTLVYEWGLSDRSERMIEILLRDPDDACRRTAAAALGSLFRGSKDSRLASMLAGVALKDSEEGHVREWAYRSFLEVLGLAQPDKDDFSTPLDFSKINWKLVKSYATPPPESTTG